LATYESPAVEQVARAYQRVAAAGRAAFEPRPKDRDPAAIAELRSAEAHAAALHDGLRRANESSPPQRGKSQERAKD
jgi:hypothetical protein